MSIRHLSGIAEVVKDVEQAVNFYRETLGLQVNHEPGTNYAEVEMPGVLHFGLWSREAAAVVIFGNHTRAGHIPLGFMIGLEVDEVENASQQAEAKGLQFLQPPKTEDWGQVTSRFLSPSGALCEFSETPWARLISQPMEVKEGQK
ncbi:VOC family protein [Chloroflexota bacterium]